MYQISKVNFGFKLTFGGYIDINEMSNWVAETKSTLSNQTGKFSVFVDMRSLKPLSQDAKTKMEEGQIAFKQKGMERSVVILNDAILTMQFKRIAKETGINQWERYINASKTPDWEKKGTSWLVDGVDPD